MLFKFSLKTSLLVFAFAGEGEKASGEDELKDKGEGGRGSLMEEVLEGGIREWVLF